MLVQPEDFKKADEPRVDAVQREVMAAISPDGRPPELGAARSGWKQLAIVGMIVAIVGVAVLFITLGPEAGSLASILLVGYIALTVPVWGAGILRGQEERTAHKIAEDVVHPEFRSDSHQSR
ncbi:MAG: hypothetical protein JNK16_13545 [Phycisphaerales bacterium]|nr:hypothetical protein [Phycisphaerales bacterium]